MQALGPPKFPMFYIGGIGQECKCRGLYKFGITHDIQARIKAHQKTYGHFELLYARKTLMRETVEKEFKRLAKSRGELVSKVYAGAPRRELLTTLTVTDYINAAEQLIQDADARSRIWLW